jgi:hypothetical protein
MPRKARCGFGAFILFVIVAAAPALALAQQIGSSTINVNVQNLIPNARIVVSPPAETVTEGSTFTVSVYLDTEGNSANTIDLTLQFPPDKLSIVNPSGGVSLIQVWLQPPTYSNITGSAHYTGVIPNGVDTASGLISTITFKAIAPGEANVVIAPESSVLANDGLGTEMHAEFGRATYVITPQPPGGVTVFSPTHPFQSQWYNNNNPVIQWDEDPGVTDFSYVLDNEPNTVPGDTPNTTGTTMAYQNLGDGLWYFHIKARKLGIWGSTTDFLMQIDTQPPAAFTPAVDFVGGAQNSKALISFFTTDSLSGVDHYEVAVINQQSPAIVSPVFVQAESPYQLSIPGPGSYHVIVRAFDKAGNVRDESIDFTISVPFIEFLKQNDLAIIIGLLLIVLLLFLLHYFFGHKLLRRVHKAILAAEREDHIEQAEEAQQLLQKEGISPPGSPPAPPPPPEGEEYEDDKN